MVSKFDDDIGDMQTFRSVDITLWWIQVTGEWLL